MNRIRRLAHVAVLLVAAGPVELVRGDEQANIVIVMADDMGYSDIGCYGGEIRTPHLDALAANGLRFTQFYNTARCCPTRAALLTGLYSHQAGVGWMMSDSGHDGYRGDLNRRCVTIAEALRPAGYSTYMSGKWHVTKQTRPEGSKENWPRQRGFDRFFGTIHGAGSFYDPNSLTLDNRQIAPDVEDFYYTDRISDYAVKYIEEHDRDRPFFLYVAYTAPHWPMHAREKDVQAYAGRYAKGWDALRAERHERMIEMGLVKREWPLTPRDSNAPAWNDVAEEERAWFERRMEVYAAMVTSLDRGVGRIVAALRDREILENTLVLFLADNGGCAEEYGSRGPITPDPSQPVELKPMEPGELQTRMQPTHTRDGRPVRTGKGVMPGPADTYIAYGLPWANASNTPFRLYKHWVHEGGIATPLIAHWPRGIERRGELEHEPGHLIDLMATCIDISGADYPEEYRGEKIWPMEGRSLVPAFGGRKIDREAIYWEHEGNRAIRIGQWKLVARGSSGPWELYDLATDRTELRDLSGAHRERARAMAAKWEAWARRANVYPLTPYHDNRERKPSQKKVFHLKHGADLPRHRAPNVGGRAFSVSARVEAIGDGVIVAQGGTAHGWALYIRDGMLNFATRVSGELTNHAASDKVPASPFAITARLAADGAMTVDVDGVRAIEGRSPRTLDQQPVDGLQVGSDAKGAVGRYDAPNPLQGKAEVVIRLE